MLSVAFFIVILTVKILSVIMFIVIMQSVMAPFASEIIDISNTVSQFTKLISVHFSTNKF